MFFLEPSSQIVHGDAVFHLQTMIFEHVAQRREQILGLQVGLCHHASTLALDDVASAGTADLHQVVLLQLLDEIGEAACSVRAFAEGGIELQHSGLQQAQLRLNAATFQNLQCAFDQRHGLTEFQRSRTRTAFAGAATLLLLLGRTVAAISAVLTLSTLRTVTTIPALPILAVGTLFTGQGRRDGRHILQQRFEADKFVAVLLEDRGGEGLAAHHVNGLAVFLELVDQRDEVAIAADDGKRIHMGVREGHFQGVEREVDIRAVLVTAGRRHTLHHLHGVFGHLPRGAFLASPVGVGELGDQVSAFFQCVQREGHVKLTAQGGLEPDLDVVVIDEHRDIYFILH